MLGMLDWIKLPVAALLGATLAMPLGYQWGKRQGQVEQLKASVQAYENREKIDDETQSLDRYDLCLRLGGLQSDCDELRGVDQATTAE